MTEKNRSDLCMLSFWSINDELNPERLKSQLRELKEAGLDGVVFHPRYYPNKPVYLGKEYMSIVNDLILYARSISMIFWIYDEDGWPSGTAGGKVMEGNPQFCAQWVSLKKDTEIDNVNDRILYSFRVKEGKTDKADSSQGEICHVVLISENGVSSLDPKAAEAFIEITHEAYRKELSKEAFDYVAGFFSDEVHFPVKSFDAEGLNYYPWTDSIGQRYKELYNEDIYSLVPLLFIEGDGCEEFRTRYWELVTDAIIEGFYQPVGDWCKKYGKNFTAHLKAEEHPYFQIRFSGSCLQVLKTIDLPAVDCLERYPGNNYYPRMLHSVAAQFGTGDCLCECMGGSGWGTTPGDFVNYILWQAGHGVRNFVLHINQLRLKSSSIRDWPPSTPCHMNWKEAFPAVLGQIRQKVKELPDYLYEAQLLIVTPTRGIMSKYKLSDTEHMNIHDGSNIPDTEGGIVTREFLQLVENCHNAGVNYEFTEERHIEEYGVVADGYLMLGNRRYNRVLIPKGCRWSRYGEEFINSLALKGISVLLPENWQKELGCEGTPKGERDNPYLEVYTPTQTAWTVEMPESNLLALEFKLEGPDTLIAGVEISKPDEIGILELICYDEVKSLSVNGHPLSGGYCNKTHGFIYEIKNELLNQPGSENAGRNGLHFQKLVREAIFAPVLIELQVCENGEKNPIALLKGKFFVKSLDEFAAFKENGVRTKGPFLIVAPGELDCKDLISSGLPFGKEPVTLKKIIEIAEDMKEVSIKLTDIDADAARISVDGIDSGWCWNPQWTGNNLSLKKGRHEVSVSIIPSTYNLFGPHRHIDGDRHVVSPEQYGGVKNFADRPDAPESTSGEYWNFVRFGISGDVVLVQK